MPTFKWLSLKNLRSKLLGQIQNLDPHRLMSRLKSMCGLKKGLIEDGLFEYTRNPNYLGEILIYLSFGVLSWHWMPFCVLVVGIRSDALSPRPSTPPKEPSSLCRHQSDWQRTKDLRPDLGRCQQSHCCAQSSLSVVNVVTRTLQHLRFQIIN